MVYTYLTYWHAHTPSYTQWCKHWGFPVGQSLPQLACVVVSKICWWGEDANLQVCERNRPELTSVAVIQTCLNLEKDTLPYYCHQWYCLGMHVVFTWHKGFNGVLSKDGTVNQTTNLAVSGQLYYHLCQSLPHVHVRNVQIYLRFFSFASVHGELKCPLLCVCFSYRLFERLVLHNLGCHCGLTLTEHAGFVKAHKSSLDWSDRCLCGIVECIGDLQWSVLVDDMLGYVSSSSGVFWLL